MKRWSDFQRFWLAICLWMAGMIVLSCWTVTEGRKSAVDWPTLVVYNETAGVIKVMDEGGRAIGRAIGGRSDIKMRFLSYSANTLQFKITGDPTIYRSPPENLWSHRCWQVRIGVMAPERDIWNSFLPCSGDT